jgi:hypothetical protein
MMGASFSVHAEPNPKRCELGNYLMIKPDDPSDWNNQPVCAVLVNKGPNIDMMKLIFQVSIQNCFKDKAIEWERVADAIGSMTQNILGGSWTSGCSPYTHNCAQSPELYVVMIESKIIWCQRNATGGYARLNEDGFVEML